MTLRPWRELIAPHDDVLAGTYQEAEFAADLSKVAAGTATPEYQDPVLFFERTFITEGMRLLLSSVVRRLAGRGGDPVVQLQTAFGGGKTHTLLAVYHVARGERSASELTGVPQIVDQVGVSELPKARVAVIDGNSLSASQPRRHGGVAAHTLWGEMAWQLGGESAYELLAQSDRDGISPGKEILARLFEQCAPCVVLLDELVAYIRQFEEGKTYSGGTFESNLSFLQALTEAAGHVPTTIVLASLPESNIEVGGARGKQALASVEKIFGRVEAVWKPVATTEGFEIVRRRLFGPVSDANARDAVCRAFAEMYVQGGGAFPPETIESAYLDRLKGSYPIHPEVFERLYTDWATLEKFQRTRGVLRLMAMTIHRLWSDGNQDLMIMPGSIPLYDPQVGGEMIRYLTQGWEPVLERDVDGPRAATTKLDEQNPLLGSVQASRRVARTVFMGSAPSVAGQRVRGISDQRLRLGCAQPGQQVGRYDDALRRLLDQLHYLFTNNERSRFWYDTRPNLRREMEDRMSRFKREEHLIPEVQKRLRQMLRQSGPFAGVHVFTRHDDVPDDQELRLVVLSPASPHRGKHKLSLAIKAASEVNVNRGAQPRQHQNRLVYLAADEDAVEQVWLQAKRYLSWASIVDDTTVLNLDQQQIKEAGQNRSDADSRLNGALREAFKWVLAPAQEAKPKGGLTEVFWEERAVPSGAQDVLDSVRKALEEQELLIPRWSPIHLKHVLQAWFWREEASDAKTADVWKAFCCYPYLPRLADRKVFEETIAAGAAGRDFFGFATAKEDERYVGFVFGRPGSVYLDQSSLIVTPDAARAQEEREASATGGADGDGEAAGGDGKSTGGGSTGREHTGAGTGAEPPPRQMKRFHGSADLNAVTMGMDAAKIAEEIVQHFTAVYGTRVSIRLEVEAYSPQGLSDGVIRTVRENARSLGFSSAEFETE